MTSPADVIIVGSGASAVHAAWPLTEGGLAVTILDVGHEDRAYDSLVPDLPFARVRREDPAQHRYFLGDRFEGISLGPLGAGPQITPPRQYVLGEVPSAPRSSLSGFAALESFALGGLAELWGAVCFPFLDVELVRCGLEPARLGPHYTTVAKRIGVSGGTDDVRGLAGHVECIQPPLQPDFNATTVLSSYRRQLRSFRRARISIGQPFMAVLTEPHDGREPNAYHDMDFWSNAGQSVYRPHITLSQLTRHPNCSYRRPYLVESFHEQADGMVRVSARALDRDDREMFLGRALILAAGAFGTTRIVLRSLGEYGTRVPFACNAHTYVPCIHYRTLGRDGADRRHSLAQLSMIYDPTGDQGHLVQAQMYSYRSLLLFRLLTESRLPLRESLRVVRSVAPSLVIWVIQHEDSPTGNPYCRLRPADAPEADVFEVVYVPDAASDRRRRAHERVMMRFMRRLGCWPLKVVRPPHGSSVHYGSQFPSTIEERPLTTDGTGRLRETRSVYVADGAALGYLPAKGPTFTLMANANRIGEYVRDSLRCR